MSSTAAGREIREIWQVRSGTRQKSALPSFKTAQDEGNVEYELTRSSHERKDIHDMYINPTSTLPLVSFTRAPLSALPKSSTWVAAQAGRVVGVDRFEHVLFCFKGVRRCQQRSHLSDHNWTYDQSTAPA